MDARELTVLISAIVISFSGVLINLVKKGSSRAVQAYQDKGSLFWFRFLVVGGLLLSLCLFFLKWPFIMESWPLWPSWLLVACGLGLRWAAIWQLGEAFTTRVSILKEHELQQTGVFRFLRHPAYAGLLLYYLGLGIAMANWACLFILVVFPLASIIQRLKVEEEVLLKHFQQEYKDYKERTWRLIPFVY